MLFELILIGKLLDSTVGQSTPKPPAVSPSKLFGRNGNGSDPGRVISKPPTKKGPALGLKKYF
jgi:hypothetical protein